MCSILRQLCAQFCVNFRYFLLTYYIFNMRFYWQIRLSAESLYSLYNKKYIGKIIFYFRYIVKHVHLGDRFSGLS